jgi:hypothetical protein
MKDASSLSHTFTDGRLSKDLYDELNLDDTLSGEGGHHQNITINKDSTYNTET